MDQLVEQYRNRLTYTSTKFVRSAMEEIDWNARLIGIKGARGVGKTTLLLQYIKLTLAGELNQVLYVTLDSLWFSENSLFDLADTFAKRGGRYLFLDEVHKYPNWSQELKNINDMFPQLKVVFTGSSLLEILNARADLSRRAMIYQMQGLSFREFLTLETGESFSRLSLKHIIHHHDELAQNILEKVRPLAHFDRYLRTGYFPFFLEADEGYYYKLKEVINLLLEIELPLLRGVEVGYVKHIKQLLYIISQSVPFIPNVSKLSDKIGIQRSTLLSYMHYLEEVKLTINLFKAAGGISKLQKPQKIYLENTNMMYALTSEGQNKGTLRETFFANQVSFKHRIDYTPQGDFLVDGSYTFEVGGKDKTKRQIENVEQSFVAADDLEYGFQNKIPLWLFGFLY